MKIYRLIHCIRSIYLETKIRFGYEFEKNKMNMIYLTIYTAIANNL